MPEQITVDDFVRETWEDYNSPTTSNFWGPKMGQCKNTVSVLEETLDYDRSDLTKMKKSMKALYSSGTMHVSNEKYVSENLEKLGSSAMSREQESDIGSAFLKFAVVTKELSGLMKNLMQSLNNIVMFPLDNFLKGDFKGVKGDLKKPFDKASKEYDGKYNKIEKEKKNLAKEAGMVRSEVTGAEIAEEMEKERRMFQLQMCEYLIKVNEIKTKKGVDLLQHLVEFYQAQTNYFKDGMKTIEHFNSYIEALVSQINNAKQRQDVERRKLVDLRESLKSSIKQYKEPSPNQNTSGYNLHQLQGNKAHGTSKCGNLLKKSEGMRKVWQRRKCAIKDGFISISHSDVTKEPVKLNLLTCQVKLIPDDPGKKCFDLISSSKNRTYHFQGEDQADMEEWISVLNNAKEAVLMQAFGEAGGGESSSINQSVKELTRTIINEVRRLPGNRQCADCGAPEPVWLSVNLGVLICLECCGVHREMGVHISRTQSIDLDRIGTAQLLLGRVVSNRGFNDIMEATLDLELKPNHTSPMEVRKMFIRNKYERHRYAIVTCTNEEDRKQDLKLSIMTQDILALLQVYAEGINFMDALPEMDNDETALHLAIQQEDGSSLHMVDFILQNSNSRDLGKKTLDGNTVLHQATKENQTEVVKLLLRVRPDLVTMEDRDGRTALEIAREMGFDTCVELLTHAISGKNELFENVNIDWNLIQDEHLYDAVDYSDDDLDCVTPDQKKTHSRPGSWVLSSSSTLPLPIVGRERPQTDGIKQPIQVSKQAKYVSSGLSATLPAKKKAPAPPPPQTAVHAVFRHGHSRNPSDPTFSLDRGHMRMPSDPPPLPVKTGVHKTNLPGAKLVLPPPPEFRSENRSANHSFAFSSHKPAKPEKPDIGPKPMLVSKPVPAPRSSSSSTPTDEPHPASTSPNENGTYSLSGDPFDNAFSGKTAPVPVPRLRKQSNPDKRCRTLYDCEADNDDELSFIEGEIIVVLREEEEEWWEGYIEKDPTRRGVFPATFVEVLGD